MRRLFVFLSCISLTNQLLSLTPNPSDNTFFAEKDFSTKGEFVCNEEELKFIEACRQGFIKGFLARIRGLIKEENDWEFVKNIFKDYIPEQRVPTILHIQQSNLSEEVKVFTIKCLDAFYLYRSLTLKTLANLDIEASVKEHQQGFDK